MDKSKLQETELRYRAIFDQSPYGIVLIDSEGNITDFNETAHRELGYTREEFARLRIADIDPFQGPEEIHASIKEVLSKGSAEFEVRHRTRNGEIRDVHVITRVLNLNGNNVFQTIWHDITEQKKAAEELNNYRHHLEEQVSKRTKELSRVNEQLQKDIAMRKIAEQVREDLILELKDAIAKYVTPGIASTVPEPSCIGYGKITFCPIGVSSRLLVDPVGTDRPMFRCRRCHP